MDALKRGDKVVIADTDAYGDLGVGEVIAAGFMVGRPVAFVAFPATPLIKLAGFERYVVDRIG